MRKNILLISIAALALTSCLEEDPRDRLDHTEAFTTVDDLILNTVANLYNYIGGHEDSQGLQGTSRGVYDLNTFTTDEAILPIRGADWFDGGVWLALYLHEFDVGPEPIGGSWKYLYKVISLCNQALEDLDNHAQLLKPDALTYYKAETRALRAMFYWYLLDLFGNVPYITSANTYIADVDQTSRKELFYKVWDELLYVQDILAEEHSNLEGDFYGRMTAPVCWFLLAKMALNAEIWTDNDWTDEKRTAGRNILLDCGEEYLNAWDACLYWCSKIQNEGYELEPLYANNFAVKNETSKENIFVIPMNKNLYANTFKNLFRSRHGNHGKALHMASENGTCATISAVRTYGYGTDHVDNRFYYNFYSDTVYVDNVMVRLDDGTPLVYNPLEVAIDLTGSPYEKTGGARMAKYEIDRTAYSDGLLQNNDIVLFRFADVLLMMSEAKVRNGENGDAEMNLVRDRVGMDFRPATLDNLLDERLMELQWEGWRRQDLIRFDRFHLPYDLRDQNEDEADRHTTVFPIPGDVIALNRKLKQNPGY